MQIYNSFTEAPDTALLVVHVAVFGTAVQLHSLGLCEAPVLGTFALLWTGVKRKEYGTPFFLLNNRTLGVAFPKIIHLMNMLKLGHKHLSFK